MTNQHVQQAHPVRSDYHLICWLKQKTEMLCSALPLCLSVLHCCRNNSHPTHTTPPHTLILWQPCLRSLKVDSLRVGFICHLQKFWSVVSVVCECNTMHCLQQIVVVWPFSKSLSGDLQLLSWRLKFCLVFLWCNVMIRLDYFRLQVQGDF